MRRVLPVVVGGLCVALALAVFVAPRADPDPDGLERVAETQGFASDARPHDLADSPLAGYGADARVPTGVAGLAGTLLTFGVALLVFRIARARRRPDRG